MDGAWCLDGELKLGQVLQPALAERSITDCRMSTRAGGGNRATVNAGYPVERSKVPYFTLSYQTRKLDGMWPLGADNCLDGSWDLVPGVRLSAPCLGGYPAHRLGDGLKLGYKEPESCIWPQTIKTSKGLYCKSLSEISSRTISRCMTQKKIEAFPFNHDTLLDIEAGGGSQTTIQVSPIGVFIELVRKTRKLDGTWKLDGSWKLALC